MARSSRRLTFGHSTAEQAVFALNLAGLRDTRRDVWNERLVDRLQAYASGREEDFRDVEVDLRLRTELRPQSDGLLPTNRVGSDNNVWAARCRSGISGSGTGRWAIDGRQSGSAGNPLPSSCGRQRHPSRLFRSRRAGDRTAALGDGIGPGFRPAENVIIGMESGARMCQNTPDLLPGLRLRRGPLVGADFEGCTRVL